MHVTGLCDCQPLRLHAEMIKAKSFTIDGEAVVLGLDGLSRFEELSRREAARTAILYAFDLIEHDGQDLRNLPFLDRKAGLARLLRETEAGILLNEHIAEDGATVFARACQLGAEGIVSKRIDSTYRSGPCRVWIQVRNPASVAVQRERSSQPPYFLPRYSATSETSTHFCGNRCGSEDKPQNKSGPAPVLAATNAFACTSSLDSRIMLTLTRVAFVNAFITAMHPSSSAGTKAFHLRKESWAPFSGFHGTVCAHAVAHSSKAGPTRAPAVASAVPPLTSLRRVRLAFMMFPT
jgi:hypothetical protein